MGAKRIELVGVDLGYPDGKSHAEGTALGIQMNQEEMYEVEQVGGGKLLTTPVMSIYRRAMETRIAQIGDDVKFYNLSTIGARIQGTIEMIPQMAE